LRPVTEGGGVVAPGPTGPTGTITGIIGGSGVDADSLSATSRTAPPLLSGSGGGPAAPTSTTSGTTRAGSAEPSTTTTNAADSRAVVGMGAGVLGAIGAVVLAF
jgi:hypothetical protein